MAEITIERMSAVLDKVRQLVASGQCEITSDDGERFFIVVKGATGTDIEVRVGCSYPVRAENGDGLSIGPAGDLHLRWEYDDGDPDVCSVSARPHGFIPAPSPFHPSLPVLPERVVVELYYEVYSQYYGKLRDSIMSTPAVEEDSWTQILQELGILDD